MEQKKLVPSSASQFPGSFASEFREDHRKQPESRQGKSILYTYFLEGWQDVSVYKSAFIEFVGSTCLCYISGMIFITLRNLGTQQVAGYVGISNIFLLMLFIYGMGPSSGGHVNPMITLTTMLTGLTPFPRGILYLVGQTIGAALAGGLLRGSLGSSLAKLYNGGGCFLDSNLISAGQAYLIESVLSFAILFISFGVGLDPRQAKVFKNLGPFLVACALGLVSFSSVGIAAGYPGAAMNPARCFAFAVARRDFGHQWIWWLGPLTGSLVQAAVYHIAPPYHREIDIARGLSNPQTRETDGAKV